MNSNHEDLSQRELSDARLTAYALGELSEREREDIEAKLARSEEARRKVEELTALAGHVCQAHRQTAKPKPSASLHAAVEARLNQLENETMSTKPTPPPQGPKSRRWLYAAIAVTACVVVIPTAAVMLMSGGNFLPVARAPSRGAGPAQAASDPSADWDLSADGEGFESLPDPKNEAASTEEMAESEIGDVYPGSGPGSLVPTPDEIAFAPDSKERAYDSVSVKDDLGKISHSPLPDHAYRPQQPPAPAEQPAAGAAPPMGAPAAPAPAAPTPPPATPAAPSMPDVATPVVADPADDGRGAGAPAEKPKSRPRVQADPFGVPPGGPPEGSAPGAGAGDPFAIPRDPEPAEPAAADPFAPGAAPAPAPPASPAADPFGAPRQQQSGQNQTGSATEAAPGGDQLVLIDPPKIPEEIKQPPRDGSLVDNLPIEPPAGIGTEEYDRIIEKNYTLTENQPKGTFSIDVDTASYSNVRRFLREGRLPPPAAVRLEEMVNYFKYDYPLPKGENPFSVSMEVASCPWNTRHRLLRIGLKGEEIAKDERGPSNLVFLIDVSGSMRDMNKLPLVKEAMEMLVKGLNEDDRVAIVTYASSAGLRLASTCAEGDKQEILRVIDGLHAGGSTYGSAGIQMAYEEAKKHFVANGTNRVILCTDGDLNVGIQRDDELVDFIKKKAKSGVFLTVLGFGTGNLKDSKLEKLADKGNGTYAYIDSDREAHKVLVDQMSGSLVTIAKDVKIQVDFNLAEVYAYRLIGYENRVMANRDFDNDKKDAGEIGAGHTVTALYELVPTKLAADRSRPSGSKYARVPKEELNKAAQSGELMTLYLRYKEPDEQQSQLLEFAIKDEGKKFGEASDDFRFAAAVASFGMVLRNSHFTRNLGLGAVEEFAAGALGEDTKGYRSEFVDIVRRAKAIRGG